LHDFCDHLVQIHRRPSHRIASGVGARQREHVVDDARQPRRLLLDDG
jgi:ribosomal protein L32E